MSPRLIASTGSLGRLISIVPPWFCFHSWSSGTVCRPRPAQAHRAEEARRSRADWENRLPAGVNVISRVVRSTSRTPVMASNCVMVRDSVGWVVPLRGGRSREGVGLGQSDEGP